MAHRSVLTRLQRSLLAELAEVAKLARLDYANILDYDSKERTPRLRLMKNQIVRSQIIADYTFVDEMLGSAICHYFFGKKDRLHKAMENQEVQDIQLLHPGGAEPHGEIEIR